MKAKIKLECSDENYNQVVSILRTLEAEVDNFDSIITTERSGDTHFRLVKGAKLWVNEEA